MSCFSDVSVIVVNCNGAADLGDCLDSLIKSDPLPMEIIVVDNGSSDESLALVSNRSKHWPRLRAISLPRNTGTNVARNIGVENATGEIVAFVDNDTVVDRKWIACARQAMDAANADAVQCKLLLRDAPDLIDSVGYLIGPLAFPRHLLRPGAPNEKAPSTPCHLFGAKAAGMMVRRPLLVQIGGFDPSFFLYGDETDLFWRLFRVGGTVALAPRSIVFHKSGGTRRFLPAEADDLLYRGGTRNYIRMTAKNQQRRRVILDVIGQAIVWLGVAAYQAVTGKPRKATLVVRGVTEAMLELPSIYRSRRRDPLPFRTVPKALKAGLSVQYVREVKRAI